METINNEKMIISNEIKTEMETESVSSEYSFPYLIDNAVEENRRLLGLDSELQEEFYAVVERMKLEEMITADTKPFVLSENYEIAKVSGRGNFYTTSFLAPICRLCATPNLPTIHIFGEGEVQKKIIKQIEHCLPIVVSETDNLSKEACQLCIEKLELCYEFQKSVLEADKQQRFMSYASTTAGEASMSELEKSSEQYSRSSTQCYDKELLRTNTDRILRISSNDEDANNNELKSVPQEVRVKNTTIEADMIVPNSKLSFEDLIPLKTQYTAKNPSKKTRIEHHGADSSTHPSKNSANFDKTTSASQIENGIFCSLPNSPISEAQSEEILTLNKKICNSKFIDASVSTTGSHEASDSCQGSELIANNKNGDYKDHEDVICRGKGIAEKGPLDAEKNVKHGIITCKICRDIFPTAKRCCTHGEIHFATNYYPCCFCGEIFETEKIWMEHIVEHYEGKDENRRSTRAKTRTSKELYEEKVIDNANELKSRLRLRKLDKKSTIINAEELKNWSKKQDKIVEKNSFQRPRVLAINKKRDNEESSDNSSQRQLFRVPEKPEALKKKRGPTFDIHCTSCKKKFRSNNLLEVHKKNYCKIVSTRRIFSCVHCEKKFLQKASLIIHLRNHTGERPYTCEFCDKSFTAKESRDCHHRIHTGEKPFQCLICEKSFARRASLRQHTAVHSEDKPYKCPFCPQHFKTTSTRNNHKRLHSGKRPYECNFCGFCFKRKDHMLKHKEAGTCRDKITVED